MHAYNALQGIFLVHIQRMRCTIQIFAGRMRDEQVELMLSPRATLVYITKRF